MTGPLSFYEHPITSAHRAELWNQALELLSARLPPSLSRLDPVTRYTRALQDWFDWIDTIPGATYQARWIASGADTDAATWLDARSANHHERDRFARALEAMIVCGAIRPGYRFLLTLRSKRLWATWREEHETTVFAELARHAEELARSHWAVGATLLDFVRICIRTGKPLAALTVEDLLDYRAAVIEVKGPNNSISCASAYHCGRAAGLFTDGPAEFTAVLTATQRSPAEIVNQYPITNPAMRILLREYLTERRPDMDYVSFSQLAHRLCQLFWCDIEAHHPDIADHRLDRAVIEAWKQRLMTLPDGALRKRPGEILLAVRCFYLDLNHWANDAPHRWAQWAAPSPVTRQDARVNPRERRRETARIHARTRELAPQLPKLIASTRRHLDHCTELLRLARATEPGASFTLDDHLYSRPTERPGSARRPALRAEDESLLAPHSLEHQAFWCWAMVEVLRHTGIRIEELLELTHHSIQPYRQPGGTIVPLLQIAPSKTDAERVIPAGPELASVLAQIIARITTTDGAIPIVIRHDEHERCWSEPMPYLFQYRLAWRARAFNSTTLREYLATALTRAGFRARLTPHDFRRLFATDAVNGGLPVHIAAQLLGHHNLDTTMGYTAIYPDEVFTRYQQFLTRRRAERPTEEYRTPTTAELAGFASHFGARRIELGNCVRPYSTPCVHEHACLRCPFQQIDPDQLPRLEQIRADITVRIDTARTRQWLGDIDQLSTTLTHLDAKRDQLLTLLAHPGPALTLPAPTT
ncbi:tyrosine-type recombinase/integrase [Nocardia sp. NPDC057227]|uniref:tyrosine-type recombinase/integrase n=1 Tax=Nocardia sp. NPDC057227 TaxID=3346056 RepID=UPI003629961E